MIPELEAFCSALDSLTVAVRNGWSGDQTFCEAWGWNCPSVTRHDMAYIPMKLAADIRAAAPTDIGPELLVLLRDYPRRLAHMQGNTVPQFWGGNCGPATAAYIATLESMRNSLMPLMVWQSIPDPKAMPGHIARRLRSLQTELDQIAPNKEALTSQIREIQLAHAAAESLPLDLQALAEAKEKAAQYVKSAESSADQAASKYKSLTETADSAAAKHIEAEKLVAQCEDAYRITTTKGLAGAFDQRASRLAWSMIAWVVGLLTALGIGSKIGSSRIELLSSALTNPELHWGAIALHIILSLLSVGAPIWFAWIATKQIGQRFKLAEDYAFKASVAKAYEGYRKEAARIDEAFEARLFNSALTRLEEAPLRLVDHQIHGSPWHEFFASQQFQAALSAIPELKEKFIEVAKQGIDAASKVVNKELESEPKPIKSPPSE